MTAPDLPADLYGAALLAAEKNMCARYPEAELYEPGTGFSWSAFLPALADAVRVTAAQAAAAERDRCVALAEGEAAKITYHDDLADMARDVYRHIVLLLRQDGDTP